MPDDPRRFAELGRASEAARRLRRVADADACVAAGVEDVLGSGRWIHPEAAAFHDEETQGVLVVKPSVRATEAFLREIVVRAAECGYVLVEARAVAAGEVRALGLARAHYHSHCAFAARGGLSPAERGALLRIYGNNDFERRHGRPAAQVPVLPVERFLHDSGTPERVVRAWSDASTAARGLDSGALDGPNELADDKYVNVFRHRRWSDDAPLFLINPHMPSVLAWWEESPSDRVALLLARRSAEALPWARLRDEFCGASDCARALPGSIRRDGLEGVLEVPVEPGEAVDRTRNVVHLSNGPIEAMREIALWFERPLGEQPAGRRLMKATGLDATMIMERALLAVDGSVRPVNGATEGLSLQQTIDRLRRGRLLPADAVDCTPETRRRIDAAHAHVAELRGVADVRAVLVTASTARNRASLDSDVDVAVITAGPTAQGIERRDVDGLLLECEWMDIERARRIASGGDRRDLKGLRESSRLGQAVAVYDPHDLAAELADAARALQLPPGEADDRLIRAMQSLDALIGADGQPGFVQWELLREVLDALAVALLTLHPVRYQKPKWVVADLREIGCEELGRFLLLSYAADDDVDAAAATLRRVHELCGRIAAAHELPDRAAVRTQGFVYEFPDWSYACRTLADAESLLADGDASAADYCGKFAARLMLRIDNDLLAARRRESASSADSSASRGAAYRALFSGEPEIPPPTDDDLETCAAWSERVMRTRQRVLGG